MKQIKWAKLGDVCKRQKGINITAKIMKEHHDPNGAVKVFAGGDTQARLNDIAAINAPSVIVKSRGYIDFAFCDEPFNHKAELWSYSAKNADEVNIKYVFYYLSSQVDYFRNAAQGVKLPQISVSVTDDYLLPLPPLDEQSRIVGVLDTFEALMSNLNTELTQRIKQMRYYSEQLLNAENMSSFEWHTLGDVGEVKMCKRILKNQTTASGEVPFYKIGTFGKSADAFISRKLFEEYKAKYSYPKKGEILLSASGTIGRTVIFDGEDAYFQDSNIVWLAHDESVILNKYLYWCYQVVDFAPTAGGTISRLYNDDLRKIKIPIPPMDEQARIAKILDTFEALLDNIRTEINQRTKQARFYKEQLLNFEQS